MQRPSCRNDISIVARTPAAYDHFGRTDLNVPWEQTDMADTLRTAAGLKSAEKMVNA